MTINTDICDRVYGAFSKMSPGIRQCVLTGEITDMFFADMERGLCRNIEDTLLYYAVRQGYEIAFAIDDKMTLRFATPEMKARYDAIVNRKSEDTQKKAGSIKRGARIGKRETSNETMQENAENAAQQVQTNASSKAQQIFDGIMNRLLPNEKKSFVILSFAEKILEYRQGGGLTQSSEQKLRSVRRWARAEHGNDFSCSVLIVEQLRLEEFNRASDLLVAGLGHHTITETIGVPDAKEIGAMLVRFKNRYNLLGHAERLSKNLSARKLPMFRVVETIKANKTEIGMKETVKLDGIFVDDDEEKRKKALTEAERELAELVGLESVKEKVRDLVNLAERMRAQKEQGVDTSAFSLHSLLLGNPGTGKTVVARILANFYYGLGLRDKDTVVEVVPGNIASQYNPGDATKNLEAKIDEAMGGVLFLDEIYKYADDQWLSEAFESTLMTAMENHRDSLTVLGASYEGERLQNLFNMNEGIESRFAHPDRTIKFSNYNAGELVEITERFLRKNGCSLASDARKGLESYIEGRIKSGNMENARGARNLAETMITRSRSTEISLMDIPLIKRESSISEILHEINEKFIGLQSVKERIKEISEEIDDDEMLGIASDAQYNMQFVGNPGTGKSTIARYMSRVFNALGLIGGTGILERRALDLKGEYIGQSGKRVQDVFYRARKEGKVLFIDEAYSLYRGAGQDSYASDIIDQLVGQITAEENSRVFIVLAGYTDEMKTLMHGNPGLQSRFPKQFIVHFPDYTEEECLRILRKRLAQKHLALYPSAEGPLLDIIAEQKEDPHFGNARAMNSLADTLRSAFVKRKNLAKSDVDRMITLEDVEAIQTK